CDRRWSAGGSAFGRHQHDGISLVQIGKCHRRHAAQHLLEIWWPAPIVAPIAAGTTARCATTGARPASLPSPVPLPAPGPIPLTSGPASLTWTGILARLAAGLSLRSALSHLPFSRSALEPECDHLRNKRWQLVQLRFGVELHRHRLFGGKIHNRNAAVGCVSG